MHRHPWWPQPRRIMNGWNVHKNMLHYTSVTSDLHEYTAKTLQNHKSILKSRSILKSFLNIYVKIMWLSPAGAWYHICPSRMFNKRPFQECLAQKSSTNVPRVLCNNGRKDVGETFFAGIFNHHHLMNVPNDCSTKTSRKSALRTCTGPQKLPATLLPKTCSTRQ